MHKFWHVVAVHETYEIKINLLDSSLYYKWAVQVQFDKKLDFSGWLLFEID